METTPCHVDRTHTGVWACDCANPGNYCSLCILDHMGSAAHPHAVRPLGPIGKYVCGKCHGQPIESVRFKYDVCLCPACVQHLTISSPAGLRIGPALAIPEAEQKLRDAESDAKQRAEVPAASEESLKRREETPRTLLQRMIVEKRNDIQQSLRRACDNMNSLEEVIQEALSLKAQFAESRAEVQRPQMRIIEGAGARVEAASVTGMNEIVERIEAVSRQNGNLLTLNSSLAEKVADLKKNLQDAQQQITELQARPPVDDARMKEVLKTQLDEVVAMLQEAISEQWRASCGQYKGFLKRH